MTLLELMTEVWENSGESTQLDPGSAEGRARLARMVNRSVRRICYYKMPDGHVFRFPHLRKVMFWRAVVYELATYVVSSSTDSTLVTGGLPTTTDQFNGWVVEVESQRRLVMDSGGGTLTVDEDWSTNPSADSEVVLYKNFYDLVSSAHAFADDNIVLDPVATVYQVIALQDMTNNKKLVADERTATNANDMTSPGEPGRYRLEGNRIYFDRPLNEAWWFRMEYYGYPAVLSLDADVPELPELFHEAVYLHALMLAYRYKMENSMAYSIKRDLQEYMQTTVMPGELKFERASPRVRLRIR